MEIGSFVGSANRQGSDQVSWVLLLSLSITLTMVRLKMEGLVSGRRTGRGCGFDTAASRLKLPLNVCRPEGYAGTGL